MPRAVVVPFGVGEHARGLGLGLAALVHAFTRVQGETIGLAQLMGRPKRDESKVMPVEAFVPLEAWNDLLRNGNAPHDVSIVLTGALEPPGEGKGLFQLMAFDPTTGAARANLETHLDGPYAGRTILGAIEEVWGRIGGELGAIREIEDLGWESLESVLYAERCVLFDPQRNAPHDRFAALIHLGRAVLDAPLAKFPAGRLAAVALEVAMVPSFEPKLAGAALRALCRAADDAPEQIDLIEASAALHMRMGQPGEAEARAVQALEKAPDRARLYAIRSEARRVQGDLEGALAAVDLGLQRTVDDGLLATERGVVLASRGDLAGAERAWTRVLAERTVHPIAFANLANLATQKKDPLLAQRLVDQALASPGAHPEVFRKAIQLSLASEPPGLARAARVAELARTLIAKVPMDAWAVLVLAEAHVALGENAAAAEGFSRVALMAAESALAAQAQRARFALTDPGPAQEIEAVLRAAHTAEVADLDVIAARGRGLSVHGVWTAAFAAGIAERRMERWTAARRSFEDALALAPGATPAHLELAQVLGALAQHDAALAHAERALVLEGRTPRALLALATALESLGRRGEAEQAARSGLGLDPADTALQALLARAARPSEPPPSEPPRSWLERFRLARS